jgi:hypothetical protein
LVPRLLQELDSDQGRPPGGVLTPGSQDGLDQGGGRDREIRGLAVIRIEARGASLTKPADQPTHRRAGHRERLGDLSGGLALLPESDHGVTYRDRDGAWHGATSGKDRHGTNLMPLYRCGDSIKPVSRFRDQTSCRVTSTEPVAPNVGNRSIIMRHSGAVPTRLSVQWSGCGESAVSAACVACGGATHERPSGFSVGGPPLGNPGDAGGNWEPVGSRPRSVPCESRSRPSAG